MTLSLTAQLHKAIDEGKEHRQQLERLDVDDYGKFVKIRMAIEQWDEANRVYLSLEPRVASLHAKYLPIVFPSEIDSETFLAYCSHLGHVLEIQLSLLRLALDTFVKSPEPITPSPQPKSPGSSIPGGRTMLTLSELLTALGNVPDNADHFEYIARDIKSGNGILPFVGAGMSMPFGFPGWGAFLLAQAGRVGIQAEIQALLDAHDYEQAAAELLKARGYLAFHDAIDKAYGLSKLDGISLTGAITRIPHLTNGPVITTNFDHLLEEVFKQAGIPFEYMVWGAKADIATTALTRNRRVLLKLHGDSEDSTDRILLKDDYDRQYGAGPSVDLTLPVPKLIQQMLLNRPLLFLGCSLDSDRTVTVLEQVVTAYRGLAHYAIVEKPADISDFYKRAQFLSDHNIRPLWYPHGRHDLIDTILAFLTPALRKP
jgi:hypothetical protein